MSESTAARGIDIPDVDVTTYVFENAGQWADKAAFIDGPTGRTLTYAELTEQIKAFAAGLTSLGFVKDDALCVYMPNVPEYAVAFHGTASIGAKCTTANPLYTAGEVAHQLEDSGARAILTVPMFLDQATEAAEKAGVSEVFVLGDVPDGSSARPYSDLIGDPADAPTPDFNPDDDIAVLPYSSGTTGLPKGVMLSHRNLVANIIQSGAVIGPSEEDVMIGCLPFFHIYGMQVIMNLGLRHGATIIPMPRFDLVEFLELIEKHKVTRLFVVPPIALGLAKHPIVDDHDLSTVDLVMSGAAPLGAELSEKLSKRIGCDVIQGYGLTETSPVTHTIDRKSNKPGSIGPPLPGTECRLVDVESGEPVEDGDRGELWIRGPQVMKGYLNNDEATANTVDSDGWLHTGDIGVRSSDDHYEIVDRLKELIKYKGFQVAPAELEALMINHPTVADVAVIGVPDEEAGELPKAYIVPSGDDFDPDALMAWVAEQVSPQKKIRSVEVIDEIPKSASGKILRRVLKDREAAAAS